MDPTDLRVTQNADFLLFTLIKQLLLVTICDTTVRSGACFQTHGAANEQTHGWTDIYGS